MGEAIFKIRYRRRPILTIFGLGLVILFIWVQYSISFSTEPIFFILLFLINSLLLIGVYSMVRFPLKDFYVLVNKEQMTLTIDGGIRKSKVLDLKAVKGMSSSIRTVRYNTYYMLQFQVTPKTWSDFYHKTADDAALNEKNYQSMFITFNLFNIKEREFDDLRKYLSDLGLKSVSYQSSVLGKYQGILKDEKVHDDNEVFRKMRCRQWIKYFFTAFFILLFFFNFLVFFIGKYIGICW